MSRRQRCFSCDDATIARLRADLAAMTRERDEAVTTTKAHDLSWAVRCERAVTDLAAMTKRAEKWESRWHEISDAVWGVGSHGRTTHATVLCVVKTFALSHAAARADVERLRAGLEELADEFECQVCQDDDELGQDDLAAARALLAETAPKETR